jgi:hypothetical protein
MAILEGATFSKTFADGFREGYRARMGNDAAIPAMPAHTIPDGVGAYLGGVAMGITAALREKPIRDTTSK